MTAVLLILVMLLTGCGGDVSGVRISSWEPSDLYTDEEIESAVKTTERYFKLHFAGCTLHQITYAGDAASEAEYIYGGQGKEYIVLPSEFDVDATGGDGSFEPNSTCRGWHWVLSRKNGGRWKHTNHGY